MAWITLWGAFAVFLTLLLAGGVAVRWFIFSSEVNLQAQVFVARGTVGVRNLSDDSQQAVRLNRTLSLNETVSTDEVAQGYIQLRDSRDGDRVVANLIFLPGSQVQVIAATRPRFRFGDQTYQIKVGNFQGRLEVAIPSALQHPIDLTIEGSQGQAHLTEAGVYLLWSLPDSMILIPRGQEASIAPLQGNSLAVPDGQTASIDANAQTISIIPTTDDLVQNPLFQRATDPSIPDAWGCYSLAELPDAPRGTLALQTVNGRRSVWIQRPGPLTGSGETGCRQFLGQDQAGLDVTGYRTLRIRTTLDIRWHSLAVCGFQGSECGLMLELTYLNEIGAEQRWIHGFYAYEHGNSDVPISCNSCLIEHDRITPGNWYSYESGNLFALPEGFRPTKLLQVRFYASGHEYETVVSEVSLLAER
jgi:hypothetical protein